MLQVNLKGLLFGLAGLLAIFAVTRAISTISDFVNHTQALERDNVTLTGNVARLTLALDLANATQSAAEEENARLKAVENAFQQKEAQLNSRLNKEREDSRIEIDRLEAALHTAGVPDISIPADVFRMQRNRAQAVNRRATEGGGDAHQQTEAGNP